MGQLRRHLRQRSHACYPSVFQCGLLFAERADFSWRTAASARLAELGGHRHFHIGLPRLGHLLRQTDCRFRRLVVVFAAISQPRS